LVLLGPPGVGKGTQAAEVQRRTGFPHISTGEMLREAMRNGSALGTRVRAVVERGDLVPDDVMGDLVEDRLEKPDARDGFLLDGFPRTPAQADRLEWILGGEGLRLDGVVNLAVPEPEIVDRLTGRRVCSSCGALYHVRTKRPRAEGICDLCGGALKERSDDRREAIEARLRAYHEQTEPLIVRYRNAGLLITIDGRGTPEEVFARLSAALPGLGR